MIKAIRFFQSGRIDRVDRAVNELQNADWPPDLAQWKGRVWLSVDSQIRLMYKMSGKYMELLELTDVRL